MPLNPIRSILLPNLDYYEEERRGRSPKVAVSTSTICRRHACIGDRAPAGTVTEPRHNLKLNLNSGH